MGTRSFFKRSDKRVGTEWGNEKNNGIHSRGFGLAGIYAESGTGGVCFQGS